MPEPILKDRAQKFGRNVMVAASVILVLAWAPGIDIEKFKPFGFEFTTESGILLSVWCLLAGILVYYFVRFSVDVMVDFLTWNPNRKVMNAKWQRARQGIRDAKNTLGAIKPTDQMFTISDLRPTKIHAWQFYILDVGLPVALFAAAAFTAYLRIVAYWPQSVSSTIA